MQESLEMNKALLRNAEEKQDAEAIKVAKEMVAAYERTIAKNPDGYWLGYQGKSDYGTFCRMAKETLRNPYMKDMKFRVIKADLRDPKAKYWLGNYENGIENAGVLRYLYATL